MSTPPASTRTTLAGQGIRAVSVAWRVVHRTASSVHRRSDSLHRSGPLPVEKIGHDAVARRLPAWPTSSAAPPTARRVPHERTHHGDTFVDDYEWLRDAEAPETLAYLEAENAWTEQRTAHLEELREQIFDEIRAHTQETDLSVPYRIGDWWYYGRSHEDKQYGASCRCPVRAPTTGPRRRLDADVAIPGEQVLVDADELAEGHEFFSLGGVSVSPDGQLLAFSTDSVGNERYLLRVKDLRTGELLPDEVPNTLGGGTWDRAGTHAVLHDRRRRLAPRQGVAARARHPGRRRRGGAPRDRRAVLDRRRPHPQRPLPGARLGVARPPRSTPSSTPTTPPASSGSSPRAARAWSTPWSTPSSAAEDVLLVLHNDGAENYALATAPVDATSHEQWRAAAAPRPRRPAGGRRRVRRAPGGQPAQRGPDPAAAGDPRRHRGRRPRRGLPGRVRRGGAHRRRQRQPGVRPADGPARLHHADRPGRGLRLRRRHPRAHPAQAHRCCRCSDGTSTRRATRRPASGRSPTDGTRVPISIVVPADAPRDGSMPMVLYGYGSYEASMDPSFSIARLSMLDRGHRLRDRARARRRRDGPAVVRRRQAAAQDEHLHRLRGLRPAPGRRPAGRRRTGWRPRAAAPAAC